MILESVVLCSCSIISAPDFSLAPTSSVPSATDQFLAEEDALLASLHAQLNSELHISPAAFQDDTRTGSAEPVPTFASEGSQRWSLLGGWGVDIKHDHDQEIAFGLKWEYFIVDTFAFAPELKLFGFFQDDGGDAFGGGLDLLFAWHFVRHDTWSIYADAGVGLLGTTDEVPPGGSEFNFTPQAGLGVTWDVGNNNRWFVGVRWHHISNAGLYSDNPGRDSIYVYTGLNMPF
ncbi:MAG: hypothetical protein CMJ36_02675 [Phycisphaerae bacterium]|nr:hypothetical protein [Phycisphaerae bacterium]